MDTATAREYLSQAEAARHALAMGQREVEVRMTDGSSVRYTDATLAQLDGYIGQLRAAVTPRRPIGFLFGR